MLRTLNRLGDRLLQGLLPGAEAQADICYRTQVYQQNCWYNCYPNPTGSTCVQKIQYGCAGTLYTVGSC
ncbi:hypothetical protein AB0C10_36275 [Microbispora amethystogenes]|uniref:hypothetical protein n=1 Tax=Microbispora amethystogenes TaxID=1427754 RepID=UPI003411BC8B